MLDKLRNFSKGKLAGVLVGIIIIPFVFWGMGSVFSGGNTNSIAKINNFNISTQNFADFINNSKISNEILRENIDNNVLEELLTQLVSTSLIELEIKELEINISDNILAKQIKKEKSFFDENNSFSRTKYEKFLLERNMHSTQFEQGIRDNELKKKLFIYISGGIKSPYFLLNKTFKDELKEVEVDYVNLNNIYMKKDTISFEEIKKYLEINKDKFLIETIDIDYIKITPENMVGENEFSKNFFSKIDEVEDLVINNVGISEISKKYNLKITTISKFSPKENKEEFLNEIYKKRNETNLEIVDKNDYFLLYEIRNKIKVLPSLEDDDFVNTVKNNMYENNKYEFNKDLIIKIQKNEFTTDDFFKISNGKVENLKLKSIKDTNKFTLDSVNLIYSLGINKFTLVSDENNNVYLTKIKNIYETNLNKKNPEITKYADKSNLKIRNNLYNSYDQLLNKKYKIEINEKTLERTKNYFR
tara:strand:+ start:1109 stop:2530 length:1422 start_codon:yes stop_codon:yes gene_type:complete